MSWRTDTGDQSLAWGYRRIPPEEYDFQGAFAGLLCWQAPTGPLAIVMASLARYCNMRRCVEIGTWYGSTSVALASAMRTTGGLYVGVDQDTGRAEQAVTRAGLSTWARFLMGPSDEVPYDGEAIDLLFIDGGHELPVVAADWNRWARWVRPTGYVIFDNYSSEPGVQLFLNDLLTDEPTRAAYEILTEGRSFGFAIFHKRSLS